MLTALEIVSLPVNDPRRIVYRIRSQQTRAPSRRLVFDLNDEEAAGLIDRAITVERLRSTAKLEVRSMTPSQWLTTVHHYHTRTRRDAWWFYGGHALNLIVWLFAGYSIGNLLWGQCP